MSWPKSPFEPRLPVRAARDEVREAEAAGNCARRAAQAEVAARDPVENRIGGRKMCRTRVDDCGQPANARLAVEVRGRLRRALKRPAGERREAAEIAGCEFKPAVNPFRREQAGIAGVDIPRRKLQRIEGDVPPDRRPAAQRKLRLVADRARERGVGELEAGHGGLTLEGDARLVVIEWSFGDGAEARRDMIERVLPLADFARVERDFRDRAQRRAGNGCVEVELADLRRAGDGARVDLETDRVVGRPAALDVEAGVGGDEMQPGCGDGGIIVEEDVALERRLAGEDRADDGRCQTFETGIEVDGEFPPGALPRDGNVTLRPRVRARGEIELGVELVERPRAVEGEPDRRQAGQVGEMGENPAGGFLRVHGDCELVGRGHISHQRLELAWRVEPLCRERKIESLGGGPKRHLAVDLKTRRHSDEGLSEREILHAELLHDNLQWQLGQKRARTGIRRRRRP